MQTQILQVAFLIATCLVYSLEIASLPPFTSSFRYVTGFVADSFVIYCFLLAIGVVIPMLFILNAVAFGSKYFLFDPKLLRKLYSGLVLGHFRALLSHVSRQVFLVLFCLSEQKSTYFILRLSYLVHDHPASHILSASLVLTLIVHSVILFFGISLSIMVAFNDKYGTTVIFSNFVLKNAHFLIPLASVFIFYAYILRMIVLRIFHHSLGNPDISWIISLVVDQAITQYITMVIDQAITQ